MPTFFVGDRMFWGNDRIVLLRAGRVVQQGPRSALVIASCLGAKWAELPRWGVGTAEWGGAEVMVARARQFWKG